MKEQNNTPSSKERFVSAQFIRPDGTIEAYENYMVSDHGRVASLVDNHGNKRPVMKIMSLCTFNKYGHLQVSLCVNGKVYHRKVHRLVLSSFYPELWSNDTNEVDHKDRNPTNNHLDNLHWTDSNGNCANRAKCPLKQIRVTYLDDGHVEMFCNMHDCSRAFGMSDKWCSMMIRKCNGFNKRLNIKIEKI